MALQYLQLGVPRFMSKQLLGSPEKSHIWLEITFKIWTHMISMLDKILKIVNLYWITISKHAYDDSTL